MGRARFVRRGLWRGVLAGATGAAASAALGRRGRLAAPLAAGAGIVAGAALESPATALVLAGAGAVVARRSARGRVLLRRPSYAAGALAAGSAAALATVRVWPRAPRTPAEIRSTLTPVGADPDPDGEGLTVVVNPAAGPAFRGDVAEQLRERLPAADILEVDDGLDLDTALEKASLSARALGIAGGDGSVGAAAATALAAGKALLVVPAGTLNHLARDLGLTGVDDAVEAFQQGRAVALDVSTIDGQPFLNTASFGTYSELVDRRERLEGVLGKWPAMFVALTQVLRHAEPVRIELDGKPRSLWMIFVGNCRYHPAGFAPSWRERLDDGLLDVRLVGAEAPWARTRLLLAVLTGRLGRCRVYSAFTARELRVRALDGPLRLAHDGEVFDGSAEFVIRKEPTALTVYAPSPESSF